MKYVRAAAVLVVSGLALAGCSAGGSAPTDPDKIGGTVTLWYLEDPDSAFMPAVKEAFEAKYPGTTVELTELPEDGFVTKIDTALLAHRPPDVSFIYEPRWIKSGQVRELDELVERESINVDNFNPVAISECEFEDHLYCLGTLTGSVMLVYNKTLFDKAGVDYPATDKPMTIDEYAAKARQLNDALGIWGASAGAPYSWTDRRTHFSEDGTDIKGYVDDAETIHFYDVLTELVQDEVAPSSADLQATLPADILAAGDAAMAITDTEYAAAALASAGYEWGVAPPPVETEGDDPFVFVGTDKYGVFTDAANPATAEALVAFLATEGNQIRVDVSDKPPLDVTLLPEWAGSDPGRMEMSEVLSLRSAPGLFVPGFWEVTAPLEDLFATVGDGSGGAESSLREAAPILQERLDREWETWDDIQR